MLALGMYYSAMSTPEVAQVVQTVKQIAGIISYQVQNDNDQVLKPPPTSKPAVMPTEPSGNGCPVHDSDLGPDAPNPAGAEATSLISEGPSVTSTSSYGSYALFGLAVTGMGYYLAAKTDKKDTDYVRV